MSQTTLFDEWHGDCAVHMRCTRCKGEGHIPDFDEDGACSYVCPACDGCGCECGENPLDEPGHWTDHVRQRE